MAESTNEPYKEKFRPASDPALDQQVDAALGDVSLETLYGFDKPQEGGAVAERPRIRGIIKGKVVRLGNDEVFVDLGEKEQGIAPILQFESVKVGDEHEFVVERFDEREGLYSLSKKGAISQNINWDTIEPGQIVEATVTGMNKGGLELEVKSMKAFMPAGQVDIHHVKDISIHIGERMTAEVTRVERNNRSLVLSRRNILEREREAAKEKLLADLAEGQIRRGVVRTVMDFGAFVDLGGVDGLLHVSEMSHRRVKHPREVVNENDIVEVKIVKIDKESGKLSLSLKAAMADPWIDAVSRYAAGTSVTARVSRVENFGAFLQLEEGIEGLLPASELSYQRIRHPSDIVKDGQTIQVIVLNIDSSQHRLTFSLKQAGTDPWAAAAERYPADTVLTAKVSRVVDFGAFVELEPGVEGLVHISELSNQRVRTVGDVAKVGQELKVRVIEFDVEKHRVSLSARHRPEVIPPTPEQLEARKKADAERAQREKKRGGLRGGLDSGGFFRG